MSKNIITIIKKEFARFFGDKRMVFTTVLMPGLLIYVLYSFMGNGLASQFETDEDYVHQIHTVNLPDSLESFSMMDNVNLIAEKESAIDEVKQEIADKDTDTLVVFPEDFDEQVAAYDSLTATSPAPNVEVYYNSTSTESSAAYQLVSYALDSYESALANKFDVNAATDDSYDLASKEDSTAQFFAMMLPMLMTMFLFSGCMAIAPESIAGEKERGTIATLLVTPIKRSELAIGKIISLSAIGLLSGLSSFVGTMLSLPKLMGDTSDLMDAGVYGVTEYVQLLIVILTTVLVIIGLISIISGFANSVKEAGTAATPLMIVVMLIGVTSMLSGGAPKEFYWYLIPIYNSVQSMNAIFSFTASGVNLAVTAVSNLVYTLLMVVVLTKIFDSEKIMYH
ncbi:MAG: ABC transporter permease subunit [Roseburia sp.]|uniref:ABC transporter permease n=1 Tax=Roseburia sp. 831b TaxID=1261635 RepID=UPI000952C927|nr:ABC transporter permease [Roseburia sp. 831b]MDD6215658.1 ABC transporter permease subunit [Roseburia sp.]WVK73142.1 ABC transporter permease subunit [Roseburia sp. 831b]